MENSRKRKICVIESDDESNDENEYSLSLMHLRIFYQLKDMLNNYKDNIKWFKNYDYDLMEHLPRIVACGDQSSGKSTSLHNIFNIPLPCKSRIGTRLPIQFHLSSKFKEKKCQFIKNSGEIEEYEYDKIEELYQKIDQDSEDDEPHFDSKICVELPSNMEILIIDLPGWVEKYLSKMKEQTIDQYLSGKQTIILNFCNVTTDPANIMSLGILRNNNSLNKKVISILTHVDQIPSDLIYQDRLENHLENDKKIFLTIGAKNKEFIDKRDEIKLLEEIMDSLPALLKGAVEEGCENDNIIYGTDNLKKFLGKKINEKLEKMTPQLIDIKNNLKVKIEDELNIIGKTGKSNNELRGIFANELSEVLRIEFRTKKSNLRKKINKLREYYSPNFFQEKIMELDKQKPEWMINGIHKYSIEGIAIELSQSVGVELPGSGGWSEIVNMCIQELIEIINDDISDLIQKIHRKYNKCLKIIFDPDKYDELFTKALYKLLEIAENKLSNLIKNYSNIIYKKLDHISERPYMITKDCIPFLVDEMFAPILFDFEKRNNQLSFQGIANQKDIKICTANDYLNMIKTGKNFYEFLARGALGHIKCFWSKCSSQILHEEFFTLMDSDVEKLLYDFLKSELNKIQIDIFNEPESTKKKREIYLTIEKMLSKIN